MRPIIIAPTHKIPQVTAHNICHSKKPEELGVKIKGHMMAPTPPIIALTPKDVDLWLLVDALSLDRSMFFSYLVLASSSERSRQAGQPSP
jgi:hypothetical protein